MPNWFPLTRPERGTASEEGLPQSDEGVRPGLPRQAKRRKHRKDPEQRPDTSPPA